MLLLLMYIILDRFGLVDQSPIIFLYTFYFLAGLFVFLSNYIHII